MEQQNDSSMKARLSPQQLELVQPKQISTWQDNYFLGLHVLWRCL